MKSISMSSLPVMIFGGSVLLVYYLWARLWFTWGFRKFRRKDTSKILTGRLAVGLHITAGVGILCILYGFFIEPYWLQVNIVPIYTDKLNSTTFRVVQMSDTHCNKKIYLENKLPDVINDLKPDIIVFTGDTVNQVAALSQFHHMMSFLKAPLGKYAVTGNWDFCYWSNLNLFGGTGFEELRQHTKSIEKNAESIVVAGVAFENGKKSGQFLRGLDAECFNLLLYHNTDLIDHVSDIPVDLYLCGHTHGGQVALPFYGALTTLSHHGKKYEAGLYRCGSIKLYVNRGIGMEGGRAPKVRFFARPEITVFDIGPQTE